MLDVTDAPSIFRSYSQWGLNRALAMAMEYARLPPEPDRMVLPDLTKKLEE